MEYRRLGNSDLKPSVIGIGALHFGNLCDEATARKIIDCGEEQGLNFIDTAPMYGSGRSESIVGKVLKGRRDRILLSTKVGLEPLVNAEGNFGVQKTPLSKKNIRISVENSLKNLQTEYLDLLQLHSFDPEVRPEETIEALESLVREGKIRYYGGSNYDPREWATMIDAFSKNPAHHFVSLQSHYNIIERKLEEAVIPQCKAAGISVLCYRGLARGILSGQYRRGAPLPQSSRGFSSQRISRHLTAEMFLLVETLENFASHFHRSPSELALSWLFSQPQVAVVILGMRHMEQVTSNCAAVDWKLTRQDLESLDAQLVKQGLMPRILSQPEVYLET